MSFFSFTSLGGERLAQTWGRQALHPGLVPWPGWLPLPAVEPRYRQPYSQCQKGTPQQHPLFRGGGSLALPLAQRPGRAAAVVRALKRCQENAVYNPGAGHVLGWLTATLFS